MKKFLCSILSIVLIVCSSVVCIADNTLAVADGVTTLAHISANNMTVSNAKSVSGTASGSGPFKSSGTYSVVLTTMSAWASNTPDELKQIYTEPQIALSVENVQDIKASYSNFENAYIGDKVLKLSQDTGCSIIRVTNLLDKSAVSSGDTIKISFNVYATNTKLGQKGIIDNSVESVNIRIGARTKQTGSEKDMQYSPDFKVATNKWTKIEYTFKVSSTNSSSAKEMHGIRIDVTDIGSIAKELGFTNTFASEMFFDNITIEKIESSEAEVTVSAKALANGNVSGGGTYKIGDKVSLTAVAKDGYAVEGWYANGMWMSDENNYTIYPTEDISYEVKFKESNPIVPDIIVSEEESFAGLVYTAESGTFTDKTVSGFKFARSKNYVSTVAPSSEGSDKVTYTLSRDKQDMMSKDDLIMASVTVKSNVGTGVVTINATGSNGGSLYTLQYYIPAQWTRINVPLIIGSEPLEKIELLLGSMPQNVEIADITVCEYTGKIEKRDLIRLSGMYNLEEFEDVQLEDPGENAIVGSTIDLVKGGNYIYSIGGDGNLGALTICDASSPEKLVKLSVLEGLGQVRQIDITNDQKYVLVTGRHNGVTIINVEDPYNPYIKSYYDSVEFATGIAISGDYAYIANRSYGVEIVDISDINNPKHLSIVRCGEAQSCKVVDGILYAGIWGECLVRMYDVKQPSEPKFLGIANLNGRGDGFSVAKSRDGTKTYIYAATGQHILGADTAGLYTDPKYAMGNGMDIYDVTDPTNPIWKSTVKIDGRYYNVAMDYWTVSFSRGTNGKDYAYLVSIYNGVYIYDVTDQAAPKRISHITVPIYKGSPNFVKISDDGKNIFQFDHTSNMINGPIGAAIATDGVLYLAGRYTDLHVYANSEVAFEEYSLGVSSEMIEKDNGTFYQIPENNYGLGNVKHYKPDGQVYYAETYGDYIFVACGNDGLHVLDKNLNFIKKYDTDRAISYFQIVDGIMYTAEAQTGMNFYTISGSTLTKIGKTYVTKENNPVKTIQITPNSKWAVVQKGRLQFDIVNIEDLNNPTLYKTYTSPGHLYYRNLMTGFVSNRYMMVSTNASRHFIIDFGKDCTSDAPVVKIFDKSNVPVLSGMVAYGDIAITVKQGNYVISNLAECMEDSVTELPNTTTKIATGVRGKPIIYKNIMMLSERIGGDIYFVDISNVNRPRLLSSYKIAGNPDLMSATDSYILLPMGYQGLIKFDNTFINVDRGDVDGDGDIDATDLATLKLYLAGAIDISTIDSFGADLNGDETINATDLAHLKLKLAGA
jgi:hypothetical protein